MKRIGGWVVAFLAALAIWLLLQAGAADREARRRAAANRPESHRHDPLAGLEASEEATIDWERGVKLDRPTAIFGTVFDAYGRPVRRAEVSAILPRPYHLVFTDGSGNYEMPVEYAGRVLLEGRLTLDLGRQRRVVDVPETGEPPRTDFRLKLAGHVYGEVMIGNTPALKGHVDIGVVDLFGDVEWDLDTDIDNGFFNFAFEPPKDVELRLVVRTLDGFMKTPLKLTFAGQPIDVGRIKLTRYPSLAVRLRLPDGTYAEAVEAGSADQLRPEVRYGNDAVADDGLPEPMGWDSRIVVKSERNETMRIALWDSKRRYLVVRSVDLVLDQLRTYETEVRPGPIPIRRRLVDQRGEPVQAEFRLGKHEVASGPDGFFSMQVPHGGVYTAFLTGYLDTDWVSLPRVVNQPWTSFLIDADDPRDCVLDLGNRLLVLGLAPFSVLVDRDDPRQAKGLTSWSLSEEATGAVGGFSPPLAPGSYRYVRGSWKMESRDGRTQLRRVFPERRDGSTIIREGLLSVLDLR